MHVWLEHSLIRKAVTIGFLVTTTAGAVSSAHAKVIFALTADNEIITFNSASPGTLIRHLPLVGGVEPPEKLNLMGIDFRPATGQLMGVSTSTLFEIQYAFPIGFPPLALAKPVGEPFAGSLAGEKIGMDFNPVVDRTRLTSDMGSNLRIDPNTGSLSAQDTNLSEPADIGDIAYSSSFTDSQATTLYGLDFTANSLVRIGGINGVPSPNGGEVTQIGPLGVDFDSNCALDFSGTELLAIVRVDGNSMLVKLDPNNGNIVSNLGVIGNNPVIRGMAVSAAPGLLNSVKLNIKRAFNKPQKDSIKFSALVDIPAGFQVDGAQIHLNIGGVLRTYVLDSKGKAALGQDKIKLNVKSKKGVVETQQAKFTAKLGGGNYVALEDEGLINTDVKDADVLVKVTLGYGSEIAEQNVWLDYRAKAGKSGKAKN